jgi:hypothetical protein
LLLLLHLLLLLAAWKSHITAVVNTVAKWTNASLCHNFSLRHFEVKVMRGMSGGDSL